MQHLSPSLTLVNNFAPACNHNFSYDIVLMASTIRFILGLGVSGGIGVGIILGGFKLRHELQVRNKDQSYFSDDNEANELKDMSNMVETSSCPMSSNFERLFGTSGDTNKDMFKDVGGRIAH